MIQHYPQDCECGKKLRLEFWAEGGMRTDVQRIRGCSDVDAWSPWEDTGYGSWSREVFVESRLLATVYAALELWDLRDGRTSDTDRRQERAPRWYSSAATVLDDLAIQIVEAEAQVFG